MARAASVVPKAALRWGALGLLISAAAVVLYAERRDIAGGLARQWLRGRGLSADITIDRLTFTRLGGHVRLGPAAHPDFQAETFDVDYGLVGPWMGQAFGAEVRAVRLVHPQITGAFDGARLTFGGLQPLIDEILAHPPPPGARRPDVAIENGRLWVSTPWGPLSATGGGAIGAIGRVTIDGAVAPFALQGPAFAVSSRGGPVHLHADGQGGQAQIEMILDQARSGDFAAAGARAILVAQLTDLVTRSGTTDAKVSATLSATAKGLSGAKTTGADMTMAMTFVGAGRLGAAGQVLTGALRGQATIATLDGALAQGRGLSARFTLADLSANHDRQGLSVRSDAEATLTVPQVLSSFGGAEGAVLTLTGRRLSGAWGAAGPRLSGDLGAGGAVAALNTKDVRLTRVTATARGRLGPEGFDMEGRLAAHGAATPAGRRALLGDGLPQTAPGVLPALARALAGMTLSAPRIGVHGAQGALTVTLPAPIMLVAASGPSVTLGPHGGAPVLTTGPAFGGALDLTARLAEGQTLGVQIPHWAMADSLLNARVTARSRFDSGDLAGGRLDLAGVARLSAGGARFDLDGCALVAGQRFALAQGNVTGLTARLCGDRDPLILADARGWRIAARLEGVAGEMDGIRAEEGTAALSAAGNSHGVTAGRLTLARITLRDDAPAPRFGSLRASGAATLRDQVWRGGGSIATAAGQALGAISAWHDVVKGEGRAELSAPEIVFAAKGLQPGEIASAAGFARDVQGQASLSGWMAWRGGDVTSGGAVTARNIAFRSPFGQVSDLALNIPATSLLPLVLGPSSLSIGRITGVLDIDKAEGRFSYAQSRLKIEEASLGLAKGRVSLEPLTIPVSSDSSVTGVLALDDIDVGELLAASSLAESIQLRAVIDGRLPFEWSPKGLRLEEGRVAATGPGRLSISRAALTGTAGKTPATPVVQVDTAQDLAYQALDNLAFDSLDASVRSAPGGRLGVLFHIKGRHDPPKVQDAVVKLADILNGSAFRKPLTLPSGTPIELTLDTSLNFSELLSAFGDIWSGRAPVAAPTPK